MTDLRDTVASLPAEPESLMSKALCAPRAPSPRPTTNVLELLNPEEVAVRQIASGMDRLFDLAERRKAEHHDSA